MSSLPPTSAAPPSLDNLTPGGGPPPQQQQQQNNNNQQEEIKSQQEAMKNQILSQVLDQQARGRLTTLTLAKPEKGAAVEAMLINMARMGQLRGDSKINEEGLIGLLEKVNEQLERRSNTSGGGKVKFDRRHNALDSDDEEEDYDL